MGQVPDPAEMVTLRAGTCRVSPCTHVMGRKVLYSLRGERRWDFTRLTALPESRTARVRFPLILTATSGAPAGRSRCMMQPASQVRAGPGGSLCGHGFITWRRRTRPAQWSLGAFRRASLLDHPPGKWRRSLPGIPLLGCIRQLYCLDEFSGGGWVLHPDRLPVRSGKCSEKAVYHHPLGHLASSAAWARAGRRGLYSHSWKCWAAQIGESPRRARISFFTSTYWSAESAGRAK